MSEPRTRVNLDHVVDLSDLVVLVAPGEEEGTFVVQNAVVDRCQAGLVDGDIIEVGAAQLADDESVDYYAGPDLEADRDRILFISATDEGGWRLVVEGAVEAASALERVEELAAGDRTEVVSSPVDDQAVDQAVDQADDEASEDAPEYDEDEATDEGAVSPE